MGHNGSKEYKSLPLKSDNLSDTTKVIPKVEYKQQICNVCNNKYNIEGKNENFIIYGFAGSCRTCDIKVGGSHDQTLEKDYSIMTKCFCCKRLIDCKRHLLVRDINICNSCLLHYSSDKEQKVCFKSPNKICDVCKKHNIVKGACVYTEAIEMEYCLFCLIKHGATRKQLITTSCFTMDYPDNLNPLICTKPILTAGAKYDEWSCFDDTCLHVACNNCKEKHRFLCKMKIYQNRIDMCSTCWTNFNKTNKNEKNS